MKIKTLIVDDEQLARDRLRQLLSAAPEIEIAGECADGRAALEFVRQNPPDLIFLDVQMPELDGFQVLDEIPDPKPVVVFVTAYDQFALKAFEVHAVEYLLKPFDRARFQTALNHAVTQVKQRERKVSQAAGVLGVTDSKPSKPAERLAVKTGSRLMLIKVADIDWVGSSGNYVEIHVGKETHLLRETLNVIETRLPIETFVRISRSVIVNVERVKELQPLFSGEYAVLLQEGTRLTLSRRFRHKLPALGLA